MTEDKLPPPAPEEPPFKGFPMPSKGFSPIAPKDAYQARLYAHRIMIFAHDIYAKADEIDRENAYMPGQKFHEACLDILGIPEDMWETKAPIDSRELSPELLAKAFCMAVENSEQAAHRARLSRRREIMEKIKRFFMPWRGF